MNDVPISVIGYLLGLGIGFFMGIRLMVSIRCDNCCQKDKPA